MSRFTAASKSIARRHSYGVIVLGFAIVAVAQAEPTMEPSARSDAPLGLSEAAQLGVDHQPLLDALDAQARAARETAVSAAQLPDPQLFGGIQDLPINTDEAYSLSRDSDTQIIVGVSQAFPRERKRRLRGEQRVREAERLDAQRVLGERAIRRDASLAWLALWREDAAKSLALAALHESELQEQAVRISASAGKASQADLVMAQLNRNRQHDDVAARAQGIEQARGVLYRWIGAAAVRPVASDPPTLASMPNRDALLDGLRDQPELVALQARIDEADAGAQLADAAYAPDWRLEIGYGNRREYSDMVLVKVGMDLPLFTRNRQDRDLASSLASRDAAQAQWQDGLRRLESDVRRACSDLESLIGRVKYYDETIVPQSQTAIDSALAGWRSGRGSLTQVLDASRVRLDVELARLDLVRDAAQRRIQLTYFSGAQR